MTLRSAQLERETERVRADLAGTLDELRSRMTAGQLVDEVIDYTREGDAAALVGNFRRQVVQNPLAVGLIGVGLSWLMMPTRKSAGDGVGESVAATGRNWSRQTADATGRAASPINEATSAGMDALTEAGRDVGTSLRDTGGQFADSVGSAREAVSQEYDRLAQSASGTAARVRKSASSVRRNVGDAATSASRNFMDTCRQQPLILAGLGLAIGAAIGAVLPRTASEDRFMGGASDDLKERAGQFAREQIEQAKEAAQEAVEEVQNAASGLGHEQREDNFGDAPSIIPPRHETSEELTARDREPVRGGR